MDNRNSHKQLEDDSDSADDESFNKIPYPSSKKRKYQNYIALSINAEKYWKIVFDKLTKTNKERSIGNPTNEWLDGIFII